MGDIPEPFGWIIVAAAVLTALATLWRKGIAPLWRLLARLSADIQRIAEATPILVDIAEEFQPNGGATLRDTVDRMEATGARLEEGMLEAIRLGNENATRAQALVDTTQHAEVLARLSVLENRQDRLITSMVRMLTEDGAHSQLAQRAAAALTAIVVTEPGGTDD